MVDGTVWCVNWLPGSGLSRGVAAVWANTYGLPCTLCRAFLGARWAGFACRGRVRAARGFLAKRAAGPVRMTAVSIARMMLFDIFWFLRARTFFICPCNLPGAECTIWTYRDSTTAPPGGHAFESRPLSSDTQTRLRSSSSSSMCSSSPQLLAIGQVRL